MSTHGRRAEKSSPNWYNSTTGCALHPNGVSFGVHTAVTLLISFVLNLATGLAFHVFYEASNDVRLVPTAAMSGLVEIWYQHRALI